MKFTACYITALFIAITSATVQPVSRTAGFPPVPAHILLGRPGSISIANFDPKHLSKLSVSLNKEVVGIPSWMAFASPDRLYAVDESSATLRLFELDLEKDKLTLKSKKDGSSGVVYLQFNADRTRLIGSAYGDGTIDVWNIEDGGLDLMKTIVLPGKPGPDRQCHKASHPHQANLDPTGRFFTINDLGSDSIIIVDAKDDSYRVVSDIYITPSGCGPRHGVFYPRGADKASHYIVVCEISNQALVYSVEYNDDYIAFKQTQSISTFGANFPPANETSAAAGAILLASNNRDLYISNRATGNKTDSITHFAISSFNCSSLRLSLAGVYSTEGLLPRMMSFAEDD